MSQPQPPPPPAAGPTGQPPWKIVAAIGLLLGGLAVAAGTYFITSRHGGGQDYRDPDTLARAIMGAKGGQAASCGQQAAGRYLCAVGHSDGTEGFYRVTVSGDGRAWSVTG